MSESWSGTNSLVGHSTLQSVYILTISEQLFLRCEYYNYKMLTLNNWVHWMLVSYCGTRPSSHPLEAAMTCPDPSGWSGGRVRWTSSLARVSEARVRLGFSAPRGSIPDLAASAGRVSGRGDSCRTSSAGHLQPQLQSLLIGKRVWRRDVVCGVPELFKFIITFRLEGKHWRKIIFHTSLLLSGMTWRLVVGRLSSCLLFVNVGI